MPLPLILVTCLVQMAGVQWCSDHKCEKYHASNPPCDTLKKDVPVAIAAFNNFWNRISIVFRNSVTDPEKMNSQIAAPTEIGEEKDVHGQIFRLALKTREEFSEMGQSSVNSRVNLSKV